MISAHMPQDIVDSIIDQFSLPTDISTLRQCALVSRSCLRPARKRLFSEISLSHRSMRNGKQCQRLCEVVSDHPNILNYIKKLRIVEAVGSDHGETDYSEHISRLLEMFNEHSNLQEMRFLNTRISSGDNHLLPPRLGQAILRLTQVPSLHTFIFFPWCNCNIPLDYISKSPGLKRLGLVDGDTTLRHSKPAVPLPISSPSRQLESLVIGGPASQDLVQYLTAPRSPLSISHIRSLNLYGSQSAMTAAAAHIVQLAKSDLKCLVWEYADWRFGIQLATDLPWHHPLDLRLLTRLRSVILVANHGKEFLITARDIITGPYGLSSTNRLEHIAVLIVHYNAQKFGQDALDEIEDYIRDPEVDMDSALVAMCNSSSFPREAPRL
ncbi:hypothetical protein FPV67DRAFT_1484896 [Lyophyllum atratum]|nr:hypothetical protein FPV67DRAFT_1484896 [Lyophyllum atratum]